MTDTTTEAFTITDEEIAVINATRTVLKEIDGRATKAAWNLNGFVACSLGRLAELADQTENSLFQVLNIGHNYTHVPMTEEQIHNQPADTGEKA